MKVIVLTDESFRDEDLFESEGTGLSLCGVFSSVEIAKDYLNGRVLDHDTYAHLEWRQFGNSDCWEAIWDESDGQPWYTQIYAITSEIVDAPSC